MSQSLSCDRCELIDCAVREPIYLNLHSTSLLITEGYCRTRLTAASLGSTRRTCAAAARCRPPPPRPPLCNILSLCRCVPRLRARSVEASGELLASVRLASSTLYHSKDFLTVDFWSSLILRCSGDSQFKSGICDGELIWGNILTLSQWACHATPSCDSGGIVYLPFFRKISKK